MPTFMSQRIQRVQGVIKPMNGCRYLDRADQFDLATAIRNADVDFRALFDSDEETSSLGTLDEDSDSEVDVTTVSTIRLFRRHQHSSS